MSKQNRKVYLVIILLLVIAFLIRLTVIIAASPVLSRFLALDSHSYLILAQSLYKEFSFINNTGPEIFRVPGYPVFISIFMHFTQRPILPVVVAQSFLDTGTCFLTWILFKKIFDKYHIASYFALVFQVCSIAAIVFAAQVLSETIFTFLFVLTLVLIESGLANKKSSFYFLAGIIAGLMFLVRAASAPVILPFAIYIWLRGKNISNPVKFLVPAVLILCLWVGRNYYAAGYPGLSTVGAINLYRYSTCAVVARQNGISFAKQQQICDSKTSSLKNQKEIAVFAWRQGVRTFKSAPLSFAVTHLQSDLNTLLPAIGNLFRLMGFETGNSGTLNVINTKGIVAGIKHYFNGKLGLFFLSIPAILILMFKYLGCLIALFYLSAGKIKPLHWFYFILILYFLIIPGPAATPRFRVPVEPLLAIYGAFGVIKLFLKDKKTIKKPE